MGPGIFAYVDSDVLLKTRSICSRYKCTTLMDSIGILGGGFNFFIIFTPILGEMIPNLRICLIHGWKHHQLQKCLGLFMAFACPFDWRCLKSRNHQLVPSRKRSPIPPNRKAGKNIDSKVLWLVVDMGQFHGGYFNSNIVGLKKYTLPETNSLPQKLGLPKEKVVSQAPLSWGGTPNFCRS